jgi:UV DNA damage endonuclease
VLARKSSGTAFVSSGPIRGAQHAQRAHHVAFPGDLVYHAEVAGWIGADTINRMDKPAALRLLRRNIGRLSAPVRSLLTLENDDSLYTPEELLPVCSDTGVPFVYDVHHHRCLRDNLDVETATERAVETWRGREPVFHLSSPLEGWDGPKPERHHDFIMAQDFPESWKRMPVTIEVEARAKELAVLELLSWLRGET